ncbi:LysR family transcriptional regulator [Actinoplanes bogorensis]|uniref:LysR family transcriptional regulator n=1 Tax=Paractinoplanes bogorensis TaxID=1610840 RepID=A0ABS5YX94_9ACTN|nr:LysR substrate-binding domain-containing protein [Actinoplanes bogorensis]MBU2668052.1 LysR family transcriptional regulator [Actinoplanes bogorensis]
MTADLDLRKLRYFVVTAETLHFGRAAELLHIAQPVLTRQIRALESELGAALFDRSSRGTELSEAGAALLPEARALLRSARALQRHARRGTRIVVGFMPGLAPAPLIRALRERFPDLEVDVIRTSWDDQVEVVHDGRAELSLVRLPIDRAGVTVVPVLSEPRVAVLSRDHHLAGRDVVTLDDLAGLPLLQDPMAVPELLGTRTAAEARPQPNVEEKLERVVIDSGFVILPRSTALAYPRPDVVLRPVDGLAPSEVALIRAESASSEVLDTAMKIAGSCLLTAGCG